MLAGRPAEELELDAPAQDDGWTLSGDDAAQSLLAGYERACAASRQVASGFSLDDCVPHPRMGQVSLRWIYVHMISAAIQVGVAGRGCG